MKKLVLIDNGHGAETKGKRSPDGKLIEYAWTRETAAMLKRMLTEQGIFTELLVTETEDVPIRERCSRVNCRCSRHGADNVVLVSLHLNAAGMGDRWTSARGWEAWTSPGQTESDRLAESLYRVAPLYLPSGTPIRRDITDGDSDKEGRLGILTGTRCPAVLTENLFQDNREESAWLSSRVAKEKIAALHADGIARYFSERGWI